jgi:hypothetical protein
MRVAVLSTRQMCPMILRVDMDVFYVSIKAAKGPELVGSVAREEVQNLTSSSVPNIERKPAESY